MSALGLAIFLLAPSAEAANGKQAPNAPASATHLRISSPAAEGWTNDPTPTVRGTTGFEFNEAIEDEEEWAETSTVTLRLFEGAAAEGKALEKWQAHPAPDGEWSSEVPTPQGHSGLPDGLYTVRAERADEQSDVVFTVDTKAPRVTLGAPAPGSSVGETFSASGLAGEQSGDDPEVTIQLFSGVSAIPPGPLEEILVQTNGGAWTSAFGGLSPGTYTIRAKQSDKAGNVGESAAVTFAVASPPPPPPPAPAPPPAAAFQWFPANPQVGETVALVSSSTDAASPIVGFAWSLSSGGAFTGGGPLLNTSFATPGGHVVQLRVTDAEGVSSIASETVPVSERPSMLMQPFPIVRIAGSLTRLGALLRLLTVEAPLGSHVTVTCHGRGCHPKSESRIANASSAGSSVLGEVTLSFRRFERAMRAGMVLQIRVTKSGEIGKFTSFTIRHHRAPLRADRCLKPGSSTPITCPPV